MNSIINFGLTTLQTFVAKDYVRHKRNRIYEIQLFKTDLKLELTKEFFLGCWQFEINRSLKLFVLKYMLKRILQLTCSFTKKSCNKIEDNLIDDKNVSVVKTLEKLTSQFHFVDKIGLQSILQILFYMCSKSETFGCKK